MFSLRFAICLHLSALRLFACQIIACNHPLKRSSIFRDWLLFSVVNRWLINAVSFSASLEEFIPLDRWTIGPRLRTFNRPHRTLSGTIHSESLSNSTSSPHQFSDRLTGWRWSITGFMWERSRVLRKNHRKTMPSAVPHTNIDIHNRNVATNIMWMVVVVLCLIRFTEIFMIRFIISPNECINLLNLKHLKHTNLIYDHLSSDILVYARAISSIQFRLSASVSLSFSPFPIISLEDDDDQLTMRIYCGCRSSQVSFIFF